MKKIMNASILLVAGIATLSFGSCRKEYKEHGFCYCKYFSGDKTKYDLTMLDRAEQVDSCNELDRLAEPFAGECELE